MRRRSETKTPDRAPGAGHRGEAASASIPLTAVGPSSETDLDLAALRERLARKRGREYWRSLEELAETPEFREALSREFGKQAPGEWAPLSRREFLRVMGATLALAGVSGCAYQPAEKIVPYVKQPEEIIPGKPLFFTTAFTRGGYALGVLGESHMGRPTKIEGNPNHPASLGATDFFAQASLLSLYDPDRSQIVRYLADPTTWDFFLGQLSLRLEALRKKRGAGLSLLLERVTSPTLAAQLERLLARYPEARLYQHEPVDRENVREGARLAFGADVHPVYHFDRAERILSLDCNFLIDEPGSVRYAHDFAEGRRVREALTRRMNRLYVVESTVTITGVNADHRLAVRPSLVEAVARAVAAAVGVPGHLQEEVPGVEAGWIAALARDLKAHRGRSLVIAGPYQPPIVHAFAHAINATLGNIGQTVTFTDPIEALPGAFSGGLRELAQQMAAGAVETLVILSSNPVYTAPADVDFKAAMERVPTKIHLGLYDDETGVLCDWHIPESHYLEAWSDARAYDGTASIVQPLIEPLYASKSAHELLAALLGEGDRKSYDIVREYWRKRLGSPDFERVWHRMLVDGVVPDTSAPTRQVSLREDLAAALARSPDVGSGTEILFRPDPCVWDGRYANLGWLQELPKPITSVTWDNPALISPATAQTYRLANGEMVELTFQGRTQTFPVWIVPGHPDETITVTLGYGRARAGKIGTGIGFNAYALRTTQMLWYGADVGIRKTGRRFQIATTQRHFNMEGRHLVQSIDFETFAANPRDPELIHREPEGPSLYAPMWPSDEQRQPGETVGTWGAGPIQNKGYNNLPVPAWGMVIDLSTCIGCQACVIACQAENNIATVGKDQVVMHRMMQWLRIDTYFKGDLDQIEETVFQPVLCMHCENAPCEPVCPVAATTHSAEGINEMTYNRCVGTRYCQNNCPYKVRRFNYLQYSDQKTPQIQLMRNPDVTVRSRGVMEKCTYCVHRINEARIQAQKEERPIRDGDLLTACQQVCPAKAIIFGNLNDTDSNGGKGSYVRQLKQEPLNYALLTELNTKPRTSYLARVRNPNPELKKAGSTTATGDGLKTPGAASKNGLS